MLADQLRFANGISLSPDESQIYFAETGGYRIRRYLFSIQHTRPCQYKLNKWIDFFFFLIYRYFLKGSNKGKLEIAADGLPGAPDNIKTDKQGNMYVSLVMPRDDDKMPDVVLNIGKYPLLRKFLTRILALTQNGVDIFDHFFPNLFWKKSLHSVSITYPDIIREYTHMYIAFQF